MAGLTRDLPPFLHFMDSATPNVLLIDDNADDALLIRQGVGRSRCKTITLHHVENGEEGLAFLRKEGQHRNAPTPELILLDINMPKMDGHEFMEELLADPELRILSVIVLTTSSAPNDVEQMMQRRCNSYVVKPFSITDLVEVVQKICDYWFETPGIIKPPL